MVCINKCFAPWKSKKTKKRREKNTRTPGSSCPVAGGFTGPSLMWTESRGTQRSVCGPTQSVLSTTAECSYMCVCVCGRCVWGSGRGGGGGSCQDAAPALGCFFFSSFFGGGSHPLHPPHVQVWTIWAQRWILGQETPLTCPFLCDGACTFLSSECVNLYTWCENSSINVYQREWNKDKKCYFLNYYYHYYYSYYCLAL